MNLVAGLAAGGAQSSPFNKLVDLGVNSQLQSQQNQQQNSLVSRREQAFTDSGLPKFMAYQNQSPTIPQTSYQMRGNNFQRIGPSGSTVPFNSSYWARNANYGVEGPKPFRRPDARDDVLPGFGAASDTSDTSDSSGETLSGQPDNNMTSSLDVKNALWGNTGETETQRIRDFFRPIYRPD